MIDIVHLGEKFGEDLLGTSFLTDVDKLIQIFTLSRIDDLANIKTKQLGWLGKDEMFKEFLNLGETIETLTFSGKENKPVFNYYTETAPVYKEEPRENAQGLAKGTKQVRVKGEYAPGYAAKKKLLSTGVPTRKCIAYIITHFMNTVYEYYESCECKFPEMDKIYGDLVEFVDNGEARNDIDRTILASILIDIEFEQNFNINDSINIKVKNSFKDGQGNIPEEGLNKVYEFIHKFMAVICVLIGNSMFEKVKKIDEVLLFSTFRNYNTLLSIMNQSDSLILDDSLNQLKSYLEPIKKNSVDIIETSGASDIVDACDIPLENDANVSSETIENALDEFDDGINF